jgi:hypothetical protein
LESAQTTFLSSRKKYIFLLQKRKNTADKASSTEASSQGNGIYEDNSYYDNNYWNMKPMELTLDDIK